MLAQTGHIRYEDGSFLAFGLLDSAWCCMTRKVIRGCTFGFVLPGLIEQVRFEAAERIEVWIYPFAFLCTATLEIPSRTAIKIGWIDSPLVG